MSKTIFLSWGMVVALTWPRLVSGTNSNFPAQFKRLLSLSQVQLNNIVFASDAGKVFILGWLLSVCPFGLCLLLVRFSVDWLWFEISCYNIPYFISIVLVNLCTHFYCRQQHLLEEHGLLCCYHRQLSVSSPSFSRDNN